MQKRSDESGSVSWQDALRLMHEVQVDYGVHIELEHGQSARKGDRYYYTASLNVKRLTGTKGFKSVHRRLVEYPNRHSATYPGTLVYHLSAVVLELERQRDEEARALAQLPLFPGDRA